MGWAGAGEVRQAVFANNTARLNAKWPRALVLRAAAAAPRPAAVVPVRRPPILRVFVFTHKNGSGAPMLFAR